MENGEWSPANGDEQEAVLAGQLKMRAGQLKSVSGRGSWWAG